MQIPAFTKVHTDELAQLQECLFSTEVFDHEMLMVKLFLLNHQLVDTEGNGNCLFRSIADQLIVMI